MAEERLEVWQILLQRAFTLIDEARGAGLPVDDWTFGGGTVLMRRHNHRASKDVDIFINDPQFIGYLSPRLNAVAESLTRDYVEDHDFVKLVFPEGEIDFVAAPPLTPSPATTEVILGRALLVETSTEIVAKKIWHRGPEFTARDIFDFAAVAELEPAALNGISPILRDGRPTVLDRLAKHGEFLRKAFELLEVRDYRRSYDECVAVLRETLAAA